MRDLQKAVKFCELAECKDPTRLPLQGLVYGSDKELVACDGHRIHIAKTDLPLQPQGTRYNRQDIQAEYPNYGVFIHNDWVSQTEIKLSYDEACDIVNIAKISMAKYVKISSDYTDLCFEWSNDPFATMPFSIRMKIYVYHSQPFSVVINSNFLADALKIPKEINKRKMDVPVRICVKKENEAILISSYYDDFRAYIMPLTRI